MYKQFLIDLKKAEPFELEAIKKVNILNGVSLKMRCDNKDYDFMTSDNKTYEVKNDMMASKTKNFYIEFMSYNKASGIETTKAEYYILIYDKNIYYLIDVIKLKTLILSHEVKFQKRVNKDKTGYGYLIPIKFIVDISTVI